MLLPACLRVQNGKPGVLSGRGGHRPAAYAVVYLRKKCRQQAAAAAASD